MTKKENKNTALPFVKTSDEETKKLLEREGLKLIDYSNGLWTFLNSPIDIGNLNFESGNFVFTNKLCI